MIGYWILVLASGREVGFVMVRFRRREEKRHSLGWEEGKGRSPQLGASVRSSTSPPARVRYAVEGPGAAVVDVDAPAPAEVVPAAAAAACCAATSSGRILRGRPRGLLGIDSFSFIAAISSAVRGCSDEDDRSGPGEQRVRVR